MRLFISFALIVALALTMSGCQTALDGKVVNESATGSNLNRIQQIKSFKSTGRIGFITQNERRSVKFSYRYSPDKEKLELISPIGSLIASLTITPSGCKAIFGDKKITATNAQELLSKQLNLNLPQVSLHELLLGVPYWQSAGACPVSMDTYSIHYQKFLSFNNCPVPTELKIYVQATTILLRQNEILELK